MSIYSRTDLAVEAHNLWAENSRSTSALQGVKASTNIVGNLEITQVEILNESGAKCLNKPVGMYYSISLKSPFQKGTDDFSDACIHTANFISSLIPAGCRSFLIAALGNPDITPDALGPIAASNNLVTHHLKNSMPDEFSAFGDTMLLRTGVLGTSGIESAAQIKASCSSFSPDCLIVIDALAGIELNRLCRCIQISSSGISPGSGVGNNREEISQATMGVPVISIGVPTVIDASAFSDEKGLASMFVTPRDIDSSVRSAARLIAYSINLAVHKGISLSDIDMLVG